MTPGLEVPLLERGCSGGIVGERQQKCVVQCLATGSARQSDIARKCSLWYGLEGEVA